MPDTKPAPSITLTYTQVGAVVVALATLGAGGTYAGFSVETEEAKAERIAAAQTSEALAVCEARTEVQPAECVQAVTDLAVCEARIELVGQALDEAKEAIGDLAAECD